MHSRESAKQGKECGLELHEWSVWALGPLSMLTVLSLLCFAVLMGLVTRGTSWTVLCATFSREQLRHFSLNSFLKKRKRYICLLFGVLLPNSAVTPSDNISCNISNWSLYTHVCNMAEIRYPKCVIYLVLYFFTLLRWGWLCKPHVLCRHDNNFSV